MPRAGALAIVQLLQSGAGLRPGLLKLAGYPHGPRHDRMSSGRYGVHADVICFRPVIVQALLRVIDLPRFAGSRVLPDRFKISQLTAGLSWAP